MFYCDVIIPTFDSHVEGFPMEKKSKMFVLSSGMYRNQRPKHVVLLKLAAQYGSEAILNSIYKRSKERWKVHVSKEKLDAYLCSKDLYSSVDTHFHRAEWIHACSWAASAETSASEVACHMRHLPCCSKEKPFTVRQIKPSAMFFTTKRYVN